MPDSPTGPEPRVEPEPRSRTITCEACESTLHPSGDVKKKSEALKTLERAQGEVERLTAEAASWKAKYEDAQARLDELRTQPAPAPEPAPERKSHLSAHL